MGVATVASNVVEAKDLNEQRDEGHQPEQQDRQAIDVGTEAELEAGVLPPHPLGDDGFDVRLDLATLAGAQYSADTAEGAPDRFSVSVRCRVSALHPLDTGARRDHERCGHRCKTDLGTLHRHLLAEPNDQRKADGRDERDKPSVLEEPA